MSLLWRLLQQIASWLDECPQVRVEHVPPAAKQEQIKGQRNPLELELRFLSTGPLFRQYFSGCIRQSAQNLDWGLISGGLLPSELASQSALGFQHVIARGTSMFYMFHKAHNTQRYWTEAPCCYKYSKRWEMNKLMGKYSDWKWLSHRHVTVDPMDLCVHFKEAKADRIWHNGCLAWVWHMWVVMAEKSGDFKFYVWFKMH